MDFLIILLIIPIIYVLIKSSDNSKIIKRLNRELRYLQQQINSLKQHETKQVVKPPVVKDEISFDSLEDSQNVVKASTTQAKKVEPDISIFESSPDKYEPKQTPEKKSRTKNDWEALIGGKILNRVGALALVIGLGFFLKYAFDNDLISETIRVLIGVTIGLLLIVGGLLFHRKNFQAFSQGLAGAGISILYLSVYASFNYYQLVPQPVAFGFMAIVTILTFIQAFHYDSLAVSILGWLGGFLTPFLLSTGQANEVGLFTYILLLDIGLLIVVLKKDSWVVLEALTIAATYLIFYIWYDSFYIEAKLSISLLFLSLFWVLFFINNFVHVSKGNKTFIELRQIVSAISIAFYYLGLYLMIDKNHHDLMGLTTVILSLIYFGNFLYVKQKQQQDVSQQIFSLITSILLFTIAIYVQFEKFTIIILWALEALIILWIGIKSNIKILWSSGIALTILAILGLLTIGDTFSFSHIKEFIPIINNRALAFLSLSTLLGMGSYLFSKTDINDSTRLRMVFNSTMSGILLIFVAVEIGDYLHKLRVIEEGYSKDQIRFIKLLSWSIGWSLLSMLSIFYGYRKNLIEMIICGLLALGLGVILSVTVGISYVPIELFSPILNFRALILFGIIAILTAHFLLLKKNQNLYDWLNDLYKIFQVVIVIVVLSLITGEIRDFYEKEMLLFNRDSIDYLSTNNLQQLMLSSSWLLYSIILIGVGIWQRSQIIRITSIIIFGVATLKIFLYDLSYLETLYRIYSFIGLGLILLFVSYLYQKYKKIVFEQE